MAATAANVSELTIEDSAKSLRWYEPAPGVYYGFCSTCGSTLFWRIDDRPELWSIAAGTLDSPTGLQTTTAWYVSEASDYHALDHTLEEHATE
jgi:hypothetical protein